MPWLAIFTFITAAISAVGQVQAGKAQKQAAEYNAAVSEQDAVAAKKKAAFDEQIQRERVRKLLSTQRAIIGKSGVDTAGTPLLALLDTAEKGELDALAIRHGGSVEAARQRSSATLSRMQGKSAQRASRFKAGTTLLTGAVKTGQILR